MDPNETMVEEFDNTEADDTLETGIVEEEQDESEAIESVLTDSKPVEEQKEEPTETGIREPGYVQKRIDKAVAKAVAETEARMNAAFEKQMAPIREKMLTDEAKELVRQGEFKTLERAKEYLQLKQGYKPTAQEALEQPQPRNEKGQFAKQDPGVQARIDMLAHQADRIKAKGGPDVIDAFNTDPEIKEKVMNGEMDFYEVAEQLEEQQQKASQKRAKPPTPMRSPNGASGSDRSTIASMSDADFDRFDRQVSEGTRYRID